MPGMTMPRAGCLLACMLLGAWAAQGQVTTTVGVGGEYVNLTDAINALLTPLATVMEIIVKGPIVLTEPGGINITLRPGQQVTIRGDQPGAAEDITLLNALPTTVLTVQGEGGLSGGSLLLEDLTISGSSTGLLVQNGANVSLNRCLVKSTTLTGITVASGSEVVVANSCFSLTVGPALEVSGGRAFVVQSTFIECLGPGIKVAGGQADVLLSLFYLNGGAGMRMNSGTLSAQYCLSQDNGSPDTGAIANPITGTVELSLTRTWPGDLAEGIQVPLNVTVPIPAEAAAYSAFDFENQPRNNTRRQVGADEEGGGAVGIAWIDTQYAFTPLELAGMDYGDGLFYVGKSVVTDIIILGNIDFVDDFVRLVPETGSVDVEGRFVRIPLIPDSINGNIGRAKLAITSTTIGDLLLDGRATVYLESNNEGSHEIFGLLPPAVSTPDRVDPLALSNSQLLVIDTTPPRIEVPAEATAIDVIASSSDVYTAASDGESDFPSDWRPASAAIPWNNALLSGAATGVMPTAFFNGSDPLTFTVGARFIDPYPEEAAVQIAGFDNRMDSTRNGTVQELLTPPADTDPAAVLYPYWMSSFPGNTLQPQDPVYASYLASDLGTMEASWTFADIPPERSRKNDWRISFNMVVRDRAKNTSDTARLNPVELWWMQYAEAKLMGNYGGNAVSSPIFSWELVRASTAPTNAAPCEPLFRYRLWGASASVPGTQALWEAVTPWTDWTRDTGTSIDPGILEENLNRQLMITVLGADEAGNVQTADLVLGDSFEGVQGLRQAGVAFDYWRNQGLAGTVDTTVSARFWHEDAEGGELRDFGAGPRIPLPTAPERVGVQFDFGIKASLPSNTVLTWEIRDVDNPGVVVAGDTIDNPSTPDRATLIFSVREGGYALYLGDPQQTKTYRMTAYATMVSGPAPSTTIVDDTPATKTFTIYLPDTAAETSEATGLEEQGDEQPFKVFVRGE